MLRPLHVSQPTTVPEASAELPGSVTTPGSMPEGRSSSSCCDWDSSTTPIWWISKRFPNWASWHGMGRRMHIGGTVTHRRLERSAEVAAHLPLLQQAAALVANVRVRNVGTLGGNLCFGDPHSDPAPVLLVYDTRVTIGKHGGGRTIGLETFFMDCMRRPSSPMSFWSNWRWRLCRQAWAAPTCVAHVLSGPPWVWPWQRPSATDASPMCGWP